MRFKTIKIVLNIFILTHLLVFDLFANQSHKDLCTEIGFQESSQSFLKCVQEFKDREKEKIRINRNSLNQEVRDLPMKNQMLENEKNRESSLRIKLQEVERLAAQELLESGVLGDQELRGVGL